MPFTKTQVLPYIDFFWKFNILTLEWSVGGYEFTLGLIIIWVGNADIGASGLTVFFTFQFQYGRRRAVHQTG